MRVRETEAVEIALQMSMEKPSASKRPKRDYQDVSPIKVSGKNQLTLTDAMYTAGAVP